MKPKRLIGSGTRKRLTLTMDANLYTKLQKLATDQKRDIWQQCLHMLEIEVKREAGRERERQRRAATRRWEREVEDLLLGGQDEKAT